jgi:hypothetical protein
MQRSVTTSKRCSSLTAPSAFDYDSFVPGASRMQMPELSGSTLAKKKL